MNKEPKQIFYETFKKYFEKIKNIVQLFSNTSINELVNNYEKE